MKYIIVTGGVVSGLGKGVTISSMGRLLQACGLKVTAIKIDPYLNVDAGTMSPFEHGEVFVLADGGESDLDLGNYERFLGLELTSRHNLTTGKIYRKVILAERKGDYLGKTVQVVPHITDCIQEWIEEVAQIPVNPKRPDEVADICLIEVGGTVGDIESSVFLEALRQFQFRVGHDNFCLGFVSLVPVLSDEQKTKPTQHGVRDLRSLGLSPSLIFCRSGEPLEEATKTKISNFCHVPAQHVLSVHDVQNVYRVPGLLQEQGLHGILQKELNLLASPSMMLVVPDLASWTEMAARLETATQTVNIALIGKYTGLQDSYLSVIKALRHASIACRVRLELSWVEASQLEEPNGVEDPDNAALESSSSRQEAWNKVKAAHGVVVPGGFGERGWQGKICAAHYCRTTGKPFLGICLGFQAMVVEYARNILNLKLADSTEVAPETPHPVILFMPEIDPETMGGTMRLGARKTKLQPLNGGGGVNGQHKKKKLSISQILYGATEISERHRHRYEVNPEYVPQLEQAGLEFVGRDAESGKRMEIAELNSSSSDHHPYYVGCQFHPEFLSRPLEPSPPFYGLILAATGGLQDYLLDKRTKGKSVA